MGQDCPSVLLYMMHSNNNNNNILGRCLQHRGGEPERAKRADGMQLFALGCIAYIVDAETN